MIIKEPKYTHNFYEGVLEGENVNHNKKYYKDTDFLYDKHDNKLNKDTLMYETYSFNEGGVNALLWGLTVMQPILINNEFNITRGHYHLDKEEPEIYFGLEGDGLLVYMKDEEVYIEKVFKGSIHYIQGEYAHRLVNTGDKEFKVGACWKESAGHDYKSIENKPFKIKVYKENGEITFKEV